MNDYLDYMDDIYEELVTEFGHEIESECIHEQTTNQPSAIGYCYPRPNNGAHDVAHDERRFQRTKKG